MQSGDVVSMALPLATAPAPDNESPVTHLMVQSDAPADGAGGCADYFAISHHGFMTTHLDALCHVFWRGREGGLRHSPHKREPDSMPDLGPYGADLEESGS